MIKYLYFSVFALNFVLKFSVWYNQLTWFAAIYFIIFSLFLLFIFIFLQISILAHSSHNTWIKSAILSAMTAASEMEFLQILPGSYMTLNFQ